MNSPSSTVLLSVVFAAGDRPDGVRLAAAAKHSAAHGFAVSLEGVGEHGNWAELLSSGLTFDCHGIAPGPAAAGPPFSKLLGLTGAPIGEAISLQPGPHIAGGAALRPVVRALLALGCDLARMPGAIAVCWHPSGCAMDPAYFNRIASDWLAGGPFPALGLTAVSPSADGGLRTEGLSFFIGQELELAPVDSLRDEEQARLAIRLIDALVAIGPLMEPRAFAFEGQPAVRVSPIQGGQTLHAAPERHAA